jgi:anthranilate synthase component II
MKILVFDNYDSFTYNLVHVLHEISDAEVDVVRNDKLQLEDAAKYDKIVLSPGPGIPSESGLLLDLIQMYAPTKSILGVCLGHQALCEAFGGTLINLTEVHHGLSEKITRIAPDPLFDGLPDTFEVGRYHSWVVSPKNLPSCFEVTAVDIEGQIMAVRHKEYDLHGVQFHPESVLTPDGKTIMKNFINQ